MPRLVATLILYSPPSRATAPPFRAQAHPAIAGRLQKICLRESSRLVRAVHASGPGARKRGSGCRSLETDCTARARIPPRPNCRLLPVRHSTCPGNRIPRPRQFFARAPAGFQKSAFIDKIRAGGGLSRCNAENEQRIGDWRQARIAHSLPRLDAIKPCSAGLPVRALCASAIDNFFQTNRIGGAFDQCGLAIQPPPSGIFGPSNRLDAGCPAFRPKPLAATYKAFTFPVFDPYCRGCLLQLRRSAHQAAPNIPAARRRQTERRFP